MSKCIEVQNDSKRFSLTINQIDNNDIIKVKDTNKVFLVVDNSKLNIEDGYIEYTQFLKQTGGIINGEIIAKNLKINNNQVWHSGNFDPNSKAAVSHGNHIPEIETADNKRFLRNDNTWQTITPANIGAQVAGNYASNDHVHTGVYQPIGNYANASHSHNNYIQSNTNVTINGNLTVTGEIISNNNITAYSDESVKKNIELLKDDIVDKLKKIKFYNYEMINDQTQRKRVGVKAQELKEIFPELVYEDKNGILSVDYIGLNIYFSFGIQCFIKNRSGE